MADNLQEIQNVPNIWTQTYSGLALDLENPSIESINIIDIIHGLANNCRYSGQCARRYSILEHVLNVCKLLQQWEPENYQLHWDGLHHDNAEAYIVDLINPVKVLCPDYKILESRLDEVIAKKFEISYPIDPKVRKADLVVLDIERKVLFKQRYNWKLPYNSDNELGVKQISIPKMEPFVGKLKTAFVKQFNNLSKKLDKKFGPVSWG